MKKITFAIIVLGSILFFAAIHAQVVGFGSGQTLTGTTNSLAVGTNSPQQYVRQISGVFTSANTVTGFTGNVYFSMNPTSVVNAQLVGTFTATNFTSTNFSFAGYYTNPPVYVILQGNMGTNVLQASEIYGPN
jgi:hypothetical protein